MIMRRSKCLFYLFFIVLTIGCSESNDSPELENKDQVVNSVDTIVTTLNDTTVQFKVFNDTVLLEEWEETNGKRHGDRIVYYPDGKEKFKGMYVHGVRIGKFGEFYKEGNLKRLSHYVPLPEREDGKRVYNVTRLNYQISFNKDNSVDTLNSFYYMIRSERDTFLLGENATVTLEYKVTHGGDSNWFETGPYVFPLYQYDSNKELEVYEFDNLGFIRNLHIDTQKSGENVYAGVIRDFNTKTDSVTEMYVQYRYYVK